LICALGALKFTSTCSCFPAACRAVFSAVIRAGGRPRRFPRPGCQAPQGEDRFGELIPFRPQLGAVSKILRSEVIEPKRYYYQYEANAKQPGQARFPHCGLALQFDPEFRPIVPI